MGILQNIRSNHYLQFFIKLPVISHRDPGLKFLQRLAIAGILYAYLIPLFMDHENGYSVCWLYNSFRLPCPGCGLTRAVVLNCHLDFVRAWYYNPFGGVITLTFFALVLSGFSHSISDILMQNSSWIKRLYVIFFLALSFAGVLRIAVQIYDPHLLGPYAVVNTKKVLFDMLPLYKAFFGF